MNTSAEPCAVIVADFAWWSQRCGEPAVGSVTEGDVDWPVCAEHLAATS